MFRKELSHHTPSLWLGTTHGMRPCCIVSPHCVRAPIFEFLVFFFFLSLFQPMFRASVLARGAKLVTGGTGSAAKVCLAAFFLLFSLFYSLSFFLSFFLSFCFPLFLTLSVSWKVHACVCHPSVCSRKTAPPISFIGIVCHVSVPYGWRITTSRL
jgi:hypothetical protein